MLGSWDRLRDDAYTVRHEVFVAEQAVPVEVELDDDDAISVHAVAYSADGAILGTGRLLPDGHIGRMEVRKLARGLGVGGQILDALIGQSMAMVIDYWYYMHKCMPSLFVPLIGSWPKAIRSLKQA